MNKYAKHLFELSDEKCREFNAKLIPNIDKKTIIGVKIPLIRNYAKELVRSGDFYDFLSSLPHTYYEENQLHVCIVSLLKNYDEVIELTEKFLPFVDNWAVCDGFNPKCFAKNKDRLYENIVRWINSEHIYTKRFAIDMLMGHYLGEAFDVSHLELVASATGEEYYLNMAVAWYFATALSKQYAEAVKVIENKTLARWTHNKAIQKAVESRCIDESTKQYLKSLKIK